VYLTGASVGLTYRTHVRVEWNSDFDIATVAYEGSTGDELWSARYNGPPRTGQDVGLAMAMGPAGPVVAGRSSGSFTDPARGGAMPGGTGMDGVVLWYDR